MNYTYSFRGGELDCELEYELAEIGARERGTGLQLEPDYEENATLFSAKLNDVDIFELLSDELVKLIEEKALSK